MPHKRNNPGCPCCGCTPQTIDAASASSVWDNVDGGWSDAGQTWETTASGALLLGTRTIAVGDDPQQLIWDLTLNDGDTVRCVWWFEDAANYWALELSTAPFPTASTVRFVQVSGGVETVLSAPQDADLLYALWDPKRLRITLWVHDSGIVADVDAWNYSVGGWSDWFAVGVPAPSGAPSTGSYRAGILAVTVADTVTLTSQTYGCDTPEEVCDLCDGGWGPEQIQVVVSGFTDGCAKFNGTYATSNQWLSNRRLGVTRYCQWLWTSESGDVRSVRVLLNWQSYGTVVMLLDADGKALTLYDRYADTIHDCDDLDEDVDFTASGSSPCWAYVPPGKARITAI